MQSRAEPGEIGVGEDEAGEREEQVDPEPADPDDVGHHRNAHHAEGVERSLQVVEEHPDRSDRADAGQLADEHSHGSHPSLVRRRLG